jgi:pimeloyl-ACP methyl ester carboxylesterase
MVWMKIYYYKQWRCLLVILATILVASCGTDDNDSTDDAGNPVIPVRGDLVSATYIDSIGGLLLDTYLGILKTNYDLNPAIVRQYNVSFYKIVYSTVDTDGNSVSASGLVAYPDKMAGDPASPLLSFHHGTIASDDDAPSNMAAKLELGAFGALFSSQGYVHVMPDYLGYGESTQLMHPYIIADGSASAVIDMLRAVRTHAAQLSHTLASELFLTGYSEGGYVTLAAQKEMETNLSAEFTITKSLPAAGPYNISFTAQTTIDLVTLPEPELLSFVMKSYDTIYSNNRISEIYQAPYAAEVDGGYFYGDAPSIMLTDTTTDLFTAAFLYGPDLVAGGDNLGLKAQFALNDLDSGWSVTTPTVFFHGADDMVVPYQNSIDAVAGLGANASGVDCMAMPADHSTCVAPYINLVLDEFGWPY